MVNFIEVADRIFINKQKYNELTDEDKINAFFILNRKFAKKYPKVAQFLNYKSVDKSFAMDQWFNVFKNQQGIPGWYWSTKSKKDTLKAKKEKDYDKIQQRYELSKEEMKFLKEFFRDDLDNDLKRIKLYEDEEKD
jgi:hypothetical protein